jgi:hypothetical protein
MARDLYYRQCFLRRQDGPTVVEQVSYIPEPYCVPGKALRLKKGDAWEDGWVVVSAGDREPAALVERRARDHLKTRKATDLGRGWREAGPA